MAGPTAESVRAALSEAADEVERAKILRRTTDDRTTVIGVRMGTVFAIAQAHAAMGLNEVDRLLDSDAYEEVLVPNKNTKAPVRKPPASAPVRRNTASSQASVIGSIRASRGWRTALMAS